MYGIEDFQPLDAHPCQRFDAGEASSIDLAGGGASPCKTEVLSLEQPM
ncbi:hypothetical protein [Mycetohabitans sp. B46]